MTKDFMRHEHFNQSVTVSDNNVAVRFTGADDALMFMGTDHTSVTTAGTGSQQVSLFNTVDTVVTNHTAGNFLLWLGYGDTGVTVKTSCMTARCPRSCCTTAGQRSLRPISRATGRS
jgi:hypothetical protein